VQQIYLLVCRRWWERMARGGRQ